MELQQYLLLPVSSKLSSKCFNLPLSAENKYQSSFLMSLSSHHTSSIILLFRFLSFHLFPSLLYSCIFHRVLWSKYSLIWAVNSITFQYLLNDWATHTFQCKIHIQSCTSNLSITNHCSASTITPTLHAILVIFSLVVASFMPIQRTYIIGRRNEKPFIY